MFRLTKGFPTTFVMHIQLALYCILVTAVLAGAGYADGVITLALETPVLQSASASSQTAESRVTTSVTGRPAQAQKVVRVGVITADKSAIRSQPNERSRIYSTCLKGTPLAVVGSSGPWLGVLMIDGSVGWIPADRVKMLEHRATIGPISRGSFSYRGGNERVAEDNPIVQAAFRYMGVPYVYGGNSTASGIDCSAFVRKVFQENGFNLPRTAREQAKVGIPVIDGDIKPGDRLYFACKHSYVDHCGIYIGGGYFIHASASRGGVAVDTLDGLYSRTLVAIMR